MFIDFDVMLFDVIDVDVFVVFVCGFFYSVFVDVSRVGFVASFFVVVGVFVDVVRVFYFYCFDVL